MNKENKEEEIQAQKDAMVNIWMTDLNETPEEKAAREKAETEKEQKRIEDSK